VVAVVVGAVLPASPCGRGVAPGGLGGGGADRGRGEPARGDGGCEEWHRMIGWKCLDNGSPPCHHDTMSSEESRSVTVRLPADLYEKLRNAAFTQRTSMNALIAEAVRAMPSAFDTPEMAEYSRLLRESRERRA